MRRRKVKSSGELQTKGNVRKKMLSIVSGQSRPVANCGGGYKTVGLTTTPSPGLVEQLGSDLGFRPSKWHNTILNEQIGILNVTDCKRTIQEFTPRHRTRRQIFSSLQPSSKNNRGW
jgi:hypothetical protein